MKSTLDVLLLIGRPASGKSEIIHYLTHLPADIRRERFHLAELDIHDDFPMLWTWFEEDLILSQKFGKERLHSDENSYFLHEYFWHLLIERLDMDYHKCLREPDYHLHHTALIEFSRGSEHGGYQAAFEHLSDDLLQRAGIVYVNVSFAESLRKNRRRFNPERPDSILEHGLSDDKMERLYRDDDWPLFTREPSGSIQVRDNPVPYVVLENEDDVTTGTPALLGERLESILGTLWELRSGIR